MMKDIIVIVGPTGVGKTKVSIELAKRLNGEIINADSVSIYKDLNIGSAKATIEEQKEAIHHLIDIREPVEEFSAGDFVSEAKKILDDTDCNIIITGGTWFYIKSLLGSEALPKCPCDFEKRKELEKLDKIVLWEKLNKLDSKRAKLIHPNNKDKVIRSIEICEYLGLPISEYKREKNKDYEALWFMPDIERDELYKRINLRVDEMINQGLYEEWQKNVKLYPNSRIIENTIGYAEFFEYKDMDTAVDKIKQHTRNFAKRQLTYFKSRSDIIKVKNVKDILVKSF